MSNIVIKSSTTGTGTYTIEAPVTNTDRVLTLPADGILMSSTSSLSSANLTGALPAIDGGALTGDVGKLLQFRYKAKGETVDGVTSSSNATLPTTAPFTLITPTFNTGTNTSTVWEIRSHIGCNNEIGAANWCASMFIHVSYDGGANWSRLLNPGANDSEGRYLMYTQNTDDYTGITYNIVTTLTPNQPYTQVCAAAYSYESDNTRWNMSNSGGSTLTCKQYSI